ncbi:HAD family hydrolase [Acidovorax sp.]|jgi:phosphoglycolate phosphatase-like HAD superfamily hydrolase|uniref:HAD family hydrolase n=1 Tax=Acidovorax sp. TaxID=1872122 RepID=UPI00391F91A1
MSIKPIIALDADGVLLDYGLAYASVWDRAFGQRPVERDKDAYFPFHRWAVEFLDGDRLAALRTCMDEQFWSCVPPLERAVDACHRLHDAGYELVCVSALAQQFEAARLKNLRDAGFPIERVIATGVAAGARSPKADAIEQLGPVVFVDDFQPYFRGIAPSVHRALICRGPNGSPNVGPELSQIHSLHANLWEFSEWVRVHGSLLPSRAV